MSKNGKLKKAQNVEKRRVQMQEALECLPLKEATRKQTVQKQTVDVSRRPLEQQTVAVSRRPLKQCTFQHCLRYVDPSCTVCPYCNHPLPDSPEDPSAHPL